MDELEEDELDEEELEELDKELDDEEEPVDGPLFSGTVQPAKLSSSAVHSKMTTNFITHASFCFSEIHYSTFTKNRNKKSLLK